MEEQDIKRTVRYWLDGALYDLDTAKSLLEAKRYPHSLFFGHLVLEKLLKAVFVNKHGQHAPLTHSLVLLAEKSGIEIPEEELGRLAEFT